jgi:hypothetical protein
MTSPVTTGVSKSFQDVLVNFFRNKEIHNFFGFSEKE